MSRPLITANQVTLARLGLLPFGTWMLYQGHRAQVFCLFFMTVVGCTDFVDGWLARRYGPTVLGGLMDPIADKVFIVMIFVPYVDLGWIPAWLVALLFLREFLITGLRSAYERRGLKLRTTFLAKIKTWVQMCGAGVLFLLRVTDRTTMIVLFSIGFVLPLISAAIRYQLRRYVWRGALVFSAWFLGTGLIYVVWGTDWASQLFMLSMLAVTWVSGWVYISQAVELLRARPLDLSDQVRIGGAALMPLALVFAVTRVGPPSVLPIIIMSLEMAVGGLDNLLCHHQAQTSALAWGARVVPVTLLGALAGVVAPWPGGHTMALGLLGLACAISLVGTTIEFVRGRHVYLDEKHQSEPLA